MKAARQSSALTENRLLAALGANERARLLTDLTEVRLKRGTILYRVGETVNHCYFPLSGMISILSTTESGKSVILGIIGNEGFASVAALLRPPLAPYEITAQIETRALRVKADNLKTEFQRCGEFQQLILNYLHRILLQISQSAVCHRFHTVEERLACWLLFSSDRAGSNEFSMKQECIAQMLGVPRTNVSMTAHPLQQRGIISYSRGRIEIINRRKLEQTACECYRVVKRETNMLYQ